MTGGLPVTFPPNYVLQTAPPVYAQPYAQAPQMPRAAAPTPAPKMRAQAPDEPRQPSKRPAVTIPSPEQLGLSPAKSSSVDWDATRSRLRQLRATCYQLDRVSEGYRFTCWLPAEEAGKSYRIQAEGGSEVEAVQFCLERAERHLRQTH